MNEAATEPESKLRWYQYSLLSLLIVMVLFCFLFAWAGYKIQQVEKQKAAVLWAEGKLGWIVYDYQRDDNGFVVADGKPPVPDWLRDWIGIDYFCDVTFVALSGTQVKDFFPLVGLASLEDLSLNGTQVSDISPLRVMTKLKRLELNGTQVSNISPLKGLKNLEVLYMAYSKVTDVSSLEGMPNLRMLDLTGTPVSGEEVQIQKLQKALPNCYIRWDDK